MRASRIYEGQVAFRDYLRSHPEVAAEYEALEHGLAAEHADAYTERKGEFVGRVRAEAIDSE